jgi:hypothetical protein
VNRDTLDKTVASVAQKVPSHLDNGLDEWTSDDDSEEKEKIQIWMLGHRGTIVGPLVKTTNLAGKENDAKGDKALSNSQSMKTIFGGLDQ